MKYNPTMMKALRRFPPVYKKQTIVMLDMVRHDAVRRTFDGVMCAAMLVLIQEFDFGTKANSTRLKRFVAKMQEYVDYNCALYDEDFTEGMIAQLKAHNVDYVGEGNR